MPCNGDLARQAIAEDRRELRFVRALACAALRWLEGQTDDFAPTRGTRFLIQDFWEYADWKEAGITREEAERWWEEHQARDERRRQQEQEAARHAAEKDAARQKAISKLSRRDAEMLGIL